MEVKMKQKRMSVLLLCIVMMIAWIPVHSQNKTTSEGDTQLKPEDRLLVLWTSGDRDVALRMVLMYTMNSKRFDWWADITLVVWGPSQKLLCGDKELQKKVADIMEAGIVVKACKACADQYGLSGKLETLGITVKYINELTDYLKRGYRVLAL